MRSFHSALLISTQPVHTAALKPCPAVRPEGVGNAHPSIGTSTTRLFSVVPALLTLAAEHALAQRVTTRPQQLRPDVQIGTEIDLQTSRVYIRVGKTGFGHEHGIEGRLASGKIRLGATQDAGELVFDMPTFTADTPIARTRVGLTGETDAATQKKVNANMLGADVLAVAKFPQAVFRIRSATPRSTPKPGEAPIYDLDGQFTLHGTTRPLRVAAMITTADGRTGLRGRFTIQQTDYGITPYSAALGAVGVADKLDIWGELWMAQASAVQR